MLIDGKTVKYYLDKYNIKINSILHVGAHECEEMELYNNDLGVDQKDIIWVDANPKLIEQNKLRGIPNCFNAVLDETERMTTFNITNNGQSSSLLEFGTHSKTYPWCVVTEVVQVQTQTLSNFYKQNNIESKKYNFWNFDIQGSELHVFRGSKELLQDVDCIYAEVNTADVYKGCGQLDEMDVLLKEYGLVRVETRITEANWGDALYIRI
jgi:FkbM family methyltransferase